MANRKLYGSLSYPDTMRALASIFEHEFDFEFIPIDLNNGENKTESFLSLSPFGQVPVFQDDDLTLFESRAIMRYISHCYSKPSKEQIYEMPKLQALVAAWIDVEDHHFNSPATKLRQQFVEKPKQGLTMEKEVVAEKEAKLGKILDVYEEQLSQSKYLGGDKFTSADLTHFPNLYFLMRTPVKRLFEERPNVSAWCRSILSRPAWSLGLWCWRGLRKTKCDWESCIKFALVLIHIVFCV